MGSFGESARRQAPTRARTDISNHERSHQTLQVGLDEWKKGKSDEIIFKMRERSNGCTGFCIRQCCSTSRPFMLYVCNKARCRIPACSDSTQEVLDVVHACCHMHVFALAVISVQAKTACLERLPVTKPLCAIGRFAVPSPATAAP